MRATLFEGVLDRKAPGITRALLTQQNSPGHDITIRVVVVGTVIVVLGSGLTVIDFEPFLVQLPLVTLTLRLTGLVEVAVQVMLKVPAPAVMDPLEIVQV